MGNLLRNLLTQATKGLKEPVMEAPRAHGESLPS